MLNKLPLAIPLALAPALASAHINIVFDYSYDTGSFFGTSQTSILEAAASVFESRIADRLGAITSSGSDSYDLVFHNPSGTNTITLLGQSIGMDELRIYVGATDLGDDILGLGGPGGWSALGSPAFLDTLDRGQSGVAHNTDFAPWGGSVSFNSDYSRWYFDDDVRTSESFSGIDFYSVALHEIAHVLGFGISDSWVTRVNPTTNTFHGPATGSQPLDPDLVHWHEGLTSTIDGIGSFEVAMDPTIRLGTRKELTDLDWNALRDIGWQATVVPEPETWALLLAGLAWVGWTAARRNSV